MLHCCWNISDNDSTMWTRNVLRIYKFKLGASHYMYKWNKWYRWYEWYKWYMWSVNLTFTTKKLSASPIGKSQNCSSHSIALELVNFAAILMQLVMKIYTPTLLRHNECDTNNGRHCCEVHLWALHMLCQCPVSVISCAHAIFALIFLHSHYYRISTVFFLDPISSSFLKIKSRS